MAFLGLALVTREMNTWITRRGGGVCHGNAHFCEFVNYVPQIHSANHRSVHKVMCPRSKSQDYRAIGRVKSIDLQRD